MVLRYSSGSAGNPYYIDIFHGAVLKMLDTFRTKAASYTIGEVQSQAALLDLWSMHEKQEGVV